MTVNLNTIQLKSGSNEPPNGFLAINELGYSINQNQLYIGKKEGENVINIPIGVSGLTATIDLVESHLADDANPHNTTKAHVGLSNVTNDKQLPISGGTLTGDLDVLGVVSGLTLKEGGTSLSTKYAASSHNHSYAPVSHTHSYLPNNYLSDRAISNPNSANGAGVTAYYLSSSASNRPPGTDHSLLTLSYSDIWSTQLASDWRTNEWYVRNQNSGTWGSWLNLLHAGNWSTYAAAKSHTHAYAASSHNHSAANITSGELTLARIPVQRGSTTINSTDKTITFPTAFAGVPSITMTYATTDVNAAGDHGCIKIHHLTKSNFQVTNSGTTTLRAVNWIAVY